MAVSLPLRRIPWLAAGLFTCMAAQAAPANSDDELRLRWLNENATVVRSLDIADTDFSDLAPLTERIGHSRVVMLGEASHGDGYAYEAKARLVRFLHETMGFDVLVWESGIYDCRVFDAALASDMPMSEVAQRGVFGVWTQTEEVRALMDYVRQTKRTTRPLIMAGMDCQFSSAANRPTFIEETFAFFDRIDPALLSAQDRQVFKEGFEWINANNYKDEPEVCRQLVALTQRLIDATMKDPRFNKLHSEREVAFMQRTLHNLIELERVNVATETIAKRHIKGLNIRNKAMGENVAWFLREYYKGHKLMVWAASSHLTRNIGTVGPSKVANLNTWMEAGRETGDTVLDVLGAEDVYSIAFSSYDYYGQTAAPGSLDGLCHRTGHPYLLIDLKNQPIKHWLREPLETNIEGLPLTANWSRIFDAVFFIDSMRAARKVKS